MAKILIVIPIGSKGIYPQCFQSVYNMDTSEHECHLELIPGYEAAEARNFGVRKAVDGGYSHILFVDSDVVVPKQTVNHLIEDDPSYILGYYVHRPDPSKVNITKLGEYNYIDMYTVAEMEKMRSEGWQHFEIHGGGAGCVLAKVDVVKEFLPRPFQWVHYDNGGVLSEDLRMCNVLSGAGYTILSDARVNCGHILEKTYNS